MTAALTIAVLYALSVTIVRIAAVTLRHTGVPDNIARLQAISALSGTGFTTSESEHIVSVPVRRKVLTVLMILGNLGLASVAATLIVALVGKQGDAGGIVLQIAAIVGTVIVTVVVMTNGLLDRLMCRFIAKVLRSEMTFSASTYEPLVTLDNDKMVAQHIYVGQAPVALRDVWPKDLPMMGLTLRRGPMSEPIDFDVSHNLEADDEIICFGARSAHEALERTLLMVSSGSQTAHSRS